MKKGHCGPKAKETMKDGTASGKPEMKKGSKSSKAPMKGKYF